MAAASNSNTSAAQSAPLEAGEIAARLLEALEENDLIFLGKDENRAAEIYTAVAAGAPDALVLLCPGSDALPGDSAPPSPANVGMRAAALRILIDEDPPE